MLFLKMQEEANLDTKVVFIRVLFKDVEACRRWLKSEKLYYDKVKLRKSSHTMDIPLLIRAEFNLECAIDRLKIECGINVLPIPESEMDLKAELKTAKSGDSPGVRLANAFREVMSDKWLKELVKEVPTKWEKHGDMVIFSGESFKDPSWKNLSSSDWSRIAKVLGADRVALKSNISNDDFRTPNVQMLCGMDTWATKKENGIIYTWDVTKTMFSVGNVSEKLRIASFDCSNETVVDLYAGIGYFTLTYLVHSRAKFVHACEWNPAAAEALRRNLEINGVKEDHCILHEGDNRKKCPKNVADRVNLGLIPTSEQGYETACHSLKLDGGILHIHGNVEGARGVKQKSILQHLYRQIETFEKFEETCSPEEKVWAMETANRIREILLSIYQNSEWSIRVDGLVTVKSYAPNVNHNVLDLIVKNIKTN